MTRTRIIAAALITAVAVVAFALAVHIWSMVPKRRKGW